MRKSKEVMEFFRKVGRKAGKVKSPAKAAAARINGRLGGRPKKEAPKNDQVTPEATNGL